MRTKRLFDECVDDITQPEIGSESQTRARAFQRLLLMITTSAASISIVAFDDQPSRNMVRLWLAGYGL
jgi:hypothetical protein